MKDVVDLHGNWRRELEVEKVTEKTTVEAWQLRPQGSNPVFRRVQELFRTATRTECRGWLKPSLHLCVFSKPSIAAVSCCRSWIPVLLPSSYPVSSPDRRGGSGEVVEENQRRRQMFSHMGEWALGHNGPQSPLSSALAPLTSLDSEASYCFTLLSFFSLLHRRLYSGGPSPWNCA